MGIGRDAFASSPCSIALFHFIPFPLREVEEYKKLAYNSRNTKTHSKGMKIENYEERIVDNNEQ